jgi:hypothetical protein
MPFTDLDRVRLEIGDNVVPMHFADDEITEKILQAGSWLLAAAQLCYIWARYILTHERDFTVGRFSESGAVAAARALNEKGAELEKQYAKSVGQAGVYVGGISVADKAAKEGDSDRTAPSFKRGYLNNPGAGW